MGFLVQPCESVDQSGWLAMRCALWPEPTEQDHRSEMSRLIARPQSSCSFVAYDEGSGEPVGFVEGGLRFDYVNGTSTSPVGFVEGVYVVPWFRGKGVARSLIAAVERWAVSQGCVELASDALLDNTESHAMHEALGFEETERVVFFRKAIGPIERRKN